MAAADRPVTLAAIAGAHGVRGEVLPVSYTHLDVYKRQADDKVLVHFDAIMGSMTPKERAKPEIINAKRKIRIANGSGTTVQQVNKVLKMHQEMSTAMKKIRKMGGLKGLGALLGRGGGIPGMGGGGGAGGLPGLGGAGLPPDLANLLNKKK